MTKNTVKPEEIVAATFLLTITAIFVPHPAYAYLDPGTSGSLFSFFPQFLTIIAVIFGFLVRPFKKLIQKLTKKKSKDSKQ